MDVNKGPLLRAEENIRKYGLEDIIQTRLSDGAKKLLPGEADTVVIAGMGGALTIRILEESREVLQSVKTFVLQPQSEISKVRQYYPMMLACHGAQEAWKEEEYRFGRYLLQERNACLWEFLAKERTSCERILAELKQKDGVSAQAALEKWQREFAMIEKTMEEF